MHILIRSYVGYEWPLNIGGYFTQMSLINNMILISGRCLWATWWKNMMELNMPLVRSDLGNVWAWPRSAGAKCIRPVTYGLFVSGSRYVSYIFNTLLPTTEISKREKCKLFIGVILSNIFVIFSKSSITVDIDCVKETLYCHHSQLQSAMRLHF